MGGGDSPSLQKYFSLERVLPHLCSRLGFHAIIFERFGLRAKTKISWGMKFDLWHFRYCLPLLHVFFQHVFVKENLKCRDSKFEDA